MAVAWSQWIVSAGLLWLGCLQGCLCVLLKAEQVYVDRQLCPGTIDAGTLHGNWKQVVFSDAGNPCSGTFRCQLSFVVKDGSASGNSLCVDYSRMQLFGKNSSLELTSNNSDSKPVMLTKRRYPKKLRHMDSEFCVSATDTVVLKFKASCNKPLDELIRGWMYVYQQSKETERIYFVDGNCLHIHRLRSPSRVKVTLRSHVWNIPDFDGPQNCKFRIAFFDDLPKRVCIRWNYLLQTGFPESVNVRVLTTHYTFDREVTTMHDLHKGSLTGVDMEHEECYPMHFYEGFLMEVSRTANRTDNGVFENGLLLLEMIVTMEDIPKTTATKIGVDTTTMMSDSENSEEDPKIGVDNSTTIFNTESSEKSDTGLAAMKISLGVAGGVVFLLLCSCFWKLFRKLSSSVKRDKGEENSFPMLETEITSVAA